MSLSLMNIAAKLLNYRSANKTRIIWKKKKSTASSSGKNPGGTATQLWHWPPGISTNTPALKNTLPNKTAFTTGSSNPLEVPGSPKPTLPTDWL